jgi:hypothetical protein
MSRWSGDHPQRAGGGLECLVDGGGLIIIAAVDARSSLWESHKKLLMTKQEVRDEHKDQEGRPRSNSVFANCSAKCPSGG